jgi:hypothetical protein
MVSQGLAAKQLRQHTPHLLLAVDIRAVCVYDEARFVGHAAPVQRYSRHVLPDG